MTMNRRELLGTGAALAAASMWPGGASAQGAFAPNPGAWRNYQVVTRLEIAKPAGMTQAWIPLPGLQRAGVVPSSRQHVDHQRQDRRHQA